MAEWVIVVTWSEPGEGIAAYGPYASQEDAERGIPSVEPYFVNPFANQAELGTGAWEDLDRSRYRTAEQCSEMQYEFGGYLNEDVEFHVLEMIEKR